MTTRQHYGTAAAYGFAALFTGTFGRNLLAFGTSAVLSRILLPEDFGLVAIALSIIALLQMFAELGTSVALIQKSQVDDHDRDSAFTITVCTTAVFVLLLWSLAGRIAASFAMPGLQPLLRIAALAYVFLGFYSLYRSILLRDLRYRTIAVMEFVGVLLSSLVAIALAYLGHGPASIIWGHVLNGAVLLVWGYLSTGYRPRSWGSLATMKELFGFGIWVAISNILGDTSQHLDKFIIGKLINARALGGYYLAQKIVMLVPTVFTSVVNQVMFPIYSKHQDDIERIEQGYWKGLRFSALAILPAMALLYVLAEPFIMIVYGDRWMSIVPIVKILTLLGALQGLGGGLFASVIYATGRPRLMLLINAFRVTVLPLCLLTGSRWGIEGIAWGFVVFGLLGRIFNQVLLTMSLGFSLRRFFSVIATPVLVNVALAVVCWLALPRIGVGMVGQVALITAGYAVVYSGLCLVLFPDDVAFVRAVLTSRRSETS